MKKTSKFIMTTVLVFMCLIFALPLSVSADTIKSIYTLDLDKYGDVITNEELGFNISTSGIITKKQLQEIIGTFDDNTDDKVKLASVGASVSTTVTLRPCKDHNGNNIYAVSSTPFHVAGNLQYHLSADTNGSNAYCIQPGVYLAGGISLSANASEVWDNLSKDKRRAINTALCYGREGSFNTLKQGTSINSDEAYIATQLIIWEIVTNERSAAAPFNLNSGKNGYLSMFCAGGANPNIKTAYTRIVSGMAKFQTAPSMANPYKPYAPTHTLTATYNERTGVWKYSSMTLTDSNGVLSNYCFAGTYDVGNATVTITQSGNKLTMSCSNGVSNGTPKSISVSSEKTGIPRTNNGSLVAYGSSYAQDVVIGGSIDPPNAYFNIRVDVKVTGTLTRDGKIQKSCWTVNEALDEDTQEGEGSLSTAENLEGWYFYVEAPAGFRSAYGVSSFILGPTDEMGFTQSISDYIINNIDPGLTYDVPTGSYNFWELGKLKSGASGNNLDSDYYFPQNWSPNTFKYGDEYPSGSIYFNSASRELTNIGNTANVFKIPFRLQKISEAGGAVANFYFTATNNSSGEVFLLRSGKTGYAYIVNNSSLYTANSDGSFDNYLPEGNYTIHELGKLKSGASGSNYATDYEIPAFFDTPTDIEVEISAEAYKQAQSTGEVAIVHTVKNTVSSYISIQKTDSVTNKALKNAVYGIYFDSSCNSLLETITTDSNGHARTISKYSTGTYYLKEITAPTNYRLNSTVYTVNVTPTTNVDNVVNIDVADTPIPTKIKLYKTDSETGTPLSDAVYGIYSNSACTILLERITTKSDGCAESKEYSPGTYYLKELKAPNGYILDSTVFSVIISPTNTEGTSITKNRTNTPYKTNIAIEKTDVDTGAYLSGAVYGLYSNQSCTTLLERLTTNSSGYAKSSNKYRAGTYYLKEITPPTNYTANTTVYKAIVTQTATTSGTVVKVSVTDEIQKAKILIMKYDPDPLANSKGVAGAKYGLYSNEACTIKLEELITGTDGSALSQGLYRLGQTVYLKEIQAPTGYKLNTTVTEMSITTENIELSATQVPASLTKPSEPFVFKRVWDLIYKPYLSITKTDSKTGAPVANADYTIYSNSSCTIPVTQLTTDSDGYAKTATQFYPGVTYYIKETSAPSGYQLSSTVYTVSIPFLTDDGEINTQVTDPPEPNKIKLTLAKSCPQTGKNVAGAKYGIYSNSACTVKLLDVTTGANGRVSIPYDFIEGNTYYIKEISAPYGYSINSTVKQVNVTATMNPVVVMTDPIKSATVTLRKVDENGNPLSGITFELYDSTDGKQLGFMLNTNNNNRTLRSFAVGMKYYLQFVNTLIEMLRTKTANYKSDTVTAKDVFNALELCTIDGSIKDMLTEATYHFETITEKYNIHNPYAYSKTLLWQHIKNYPLGINGWWQSEE